MNVIRHIHAVQNDRTTRSVFVWTGAGGVVFATMCVVVVG